MVALPPELEELELDEELDVLELEELDDDELLLDELEELDELLLEDEEDELEELLLLELEEEELDELLLDPLGIEHSLIPPGTRVPAPKVTSPQMKLPFSVMKVNWSLRPNATLVGTLTEQFCLPLLVEQIVT